MELKLAEYTQSFLSACPSAAGPAWGWLSVGRVGRHPRATGCCAAQNLDEIGLKRLWGVRLQLLKV